MLRRCVFVCACGVNGDVYMEVGALVVVAVVGTRLSCDALSNKSVVV